MIIEHNYGCNAVVSCPVCIPFTAESGGRFISSNRILCKLDIICPVRSLHKATRVVDLGLTSHDLDWFQGLERGRGRPFASLVTLRSVQTQQTLSLSTVQITHFLWGRELGLEPTGQVRVDPIMYFMDTLWNVSRTVQTLCTPECALYSPHDQCVSPCLLLSAYWVPPVKTKCAGNG